MNKEIVSKFLETITPEEEKEFLQWLSGQDQETWEETIRIQTLIVNDHREDFERENGKDHQAEFLYGTLICSISWMQWKIEADFWLKVAVQNPPVGMEKMLISIWLKSIGIRENLPQDQQTHFDTAMAVLSVPHFWWKGLEELLSALTYEELDRIGEGRLQLLGR
jgi:hypothetical protein